MALRVYLDGTPGGTDGIELSPDNGLALNKFMFPNSFSQNSADMVVPLCLRCDEGHTALSISINLYNGVFFGSNTELYNTVNSLESALSQQHFNGNTASNYSPNLEVGGTNSVFMVLFHSTESILGAGNLFSMSYAET